VSSAPLDGLGRLETVLLAGNPVADTDHDGVQDPNDNCPSVANPDQRDTDMANAGGGYETGGGQGIIAPWSSRKTLQRECVTLAWD